MNVRLGRVSTLVIVLSALGPAAAIGSDEGRTSSAGEVAHATDEGWTSRALAAFYVSDAAQAGDNQAPTRSDGETATPNVASADIKFMSDGRDSAADQTARQQAERETVDDAAAGAALREAMTAQTPRDEEPRIERLPPTERGQAAARLPAGLPAAEPASPKSGDVLLAARTFADDHVLTAANDVSATVLPYHPNADQQPVPPADFGASSTCDTCGAECYDGCCESCCESPCCETGCCPPRRVLFWTAGVEATFLFPDTNSEGTSFLVEETANSRSDLITSSTDDVDSMYVSPRVWVGIQGCKWGANLRYWHLQAGEGSFDPSVDGNGDWGYGSLLDTGYSACNHLEAYTIDLEGTRRFCINDCWMQASFGVRHAEITHNESLWGTAIADDGDTRIFGVARANRFTRGTGVVFGLYGRRPVFPCSCVNWFWNARWSALWGPTETSAETGVLLTADTLNAVANAGSNNSASTAVDDTMFIGEIQLGLEWDYPLQCLPANAFCRAALEYQRWDGGTGYSAAGSFADVTINNAVTTRGETAAFAPAIELDLVGITFGTGLTW